MVRCAADIRSKETQADYREKSAAGTSREVIKGLLLDAERETQRVRHRDFLASFTERAAQRFHVRNQKSSLHIVIGMKALSARQSECALKTPLGGFLVFECGRRANGLGDREVAVLHFPGTNVVCQHAELNARTDAALQSEICVGGVILANQRPKQHVAHCIPSDQRGFSPRPPYFE